MFRYAGQRLLVALPVLWAAYTLSFLLIRAAPGDPVAIMFGPGHGTGSQEGVTQEQRAERRRELGIDRPWPEQYAAWLGRVAQGDLGTSFKSRRPILAEMAERLPATAALAAAAFAIQAVLALGLGAWSARRPGSVTDHLTRALSLVLVAVPSYWLGLLLLYFFAVQLQWVTVAGPPTPGRLVLPAVTLGLVLTPTVLRVFRASVVEQYRRPHVAFARAKGLGEGTILRRHVARLALLPAVTLLGISLTELLGGAVIVESVFSWPGVGKYLIDSILARDYPVVQGYILFATTAVIGGNLAVDLLYGLIDPRIRAGEGAGG